MMLLCLVLVFTVVAAASSQQAPEWPQWRGPNGDGVTMETGWNPTALRSGAKVLWKADVGYGYSNVVIQHGRLYAMGAMSRKGVVFSCLDAATGAVLWQQGYDQGGAYDNPDPQATPVVDGDRIYGLTTKGVVVCLRSADGQILWTKDLVAEFKTKGARHYGFVASPVVTGDRLLINASEFGIALDKHTGDPLWVTAVDEEWKGYRRDYGALTTPVVCTLNERECALFINEYALIAVNLDTGETLWSFPLDPTYGHVVQDPVVDHDRVLVLGSIQLNCSGTEPWVIWSDGAVRNDLANPVLVDGYLYGYLWDYMDPAGASNYDWEATRRINMFFRCIEWKSGKMMWQEIIKGGVSLIAADGKLIMLELNGTLRIAMASPTGYEELSSADVLQGAKKARIFPTPPVFCDGRIYCRNFANDLVCIDVSN